MFDELPVEKPKEDAPPVFGFELRPRFIQAGTEFKLICEVQAYPIPKVRHCGKWSMTIASVISPHPPPLYQSWEGWGYYCKVQTYPIPKVRHYGKWSMVTTSVVIPPPSNHNKVWWVGGGWEWGEAGMLRSLCCFRR